MKLKLETRFIGNSVDVSADYLIENAALASDPPLAPLLLGLICASPFLILALIVCLMLN